MHGRYREEDLAHRLAEELEREEREAQQKAGEEMASLIFEKKAFTGSEEATSEVEAPLQAESAPVRSADAGAHGIEPEIPKSPAEQLAGILLYGEGVPLQPWQRG